MDAHSTVTAEEGDRYPLGPPSLRATSPGHFLFGALGPATVALPQRSAWLADTVTRRIRSEVTLKGGSLLTERPLAMRKRSLSGSGWKVCENCGEIQEMMHYNYRRGMQSILVFIVKHR